MRNKKNKKIYLPWNSVKMLVEEKGIFIENFVAVAKEEFNPIENEIAPLFNEQLFVQLHSAELSQLYQTLFSVYCYDPKNSSKLTLNMSEKSAQNGQKVMALMSQTSSIKPDSNLLSLLKKSHVPTLLVHGEEDIVPLWTAEEIKTTIPNAKIAILKQCGHFPYIEQPKLLFNKLQDFLSQPP